MLARELGSAQSCLGTWTKRFLLTDGNGLVLKQYHMHARLEIHALVSALERGESMLYAAVEVRGQIKSRRHARARMHVRTLVNTLSVHIPVATFSSNDWTAGGLIHTCMHPLMTGQYVNGYMHLRTC